MEAGWYWVMLHPSVQPSIWQPGYYSDVNDEWRLINIEGDCSFLIHKISFKIEYPEEFE